MNRKIAEDSVAHPELFFWFGGIPDAELKAWMDRAKICAPLDLVDFWRRFGGGDLFETETMLGPFGDPVLGDDIEGVNHLHHSKGLPEGYLLFHRGIYLSAVRLLDGQYVTLGHSYSLISDCRSLDEWYVSLRSEFSAQYSLGE